MKRGKSTGAPTKAEQQRFEAIKQLGCIACLSDPDSIFERCGPIEIHHLVDKGYRKHSGGHMATIPLGAWHHRGVPPSWIGYVSKAEAMFGPSLALSKKAFIKRYGTERELLETVNTKLIEKELLEVK